MKVRNEHGLTRSQKKRLFTILVELQGALESVHNAGGTTADVERWKKPLLERASAILGEDLTRYHQTIATLRRRGVVDELQEEADQEEEANRLRRIKRAERLDLPYDHRDRRFIEGYDADADWCDRYSSDY